MPRARAGPSWANWSPACSGLTPLSARTCSVVSPVSTDQPGAFLSAFFALVGLHGVHVTIGLLWLGTMMAQFRAKGFRPDIARRGLCFALFWHALDIIWVGIFTNVYLLGTIP